jgi:hypothetical protein
MAVRQSKILADPDESIVLSLNTPTSGKMDGFGLGYLALTQPRPFRFG